MQLGRVIDKVKVAARESATKSSVPQPTPMGKCEESLSPMSSLVLVAKK